MPRNFIEKDPEAVKKDLRGRQVGAETESWHSTWRPVRCPEEGPVAEGSLLTDVKPGFEMDERL